MLSNLKIENIAVIESASIDFSEGFTCMTGETGAGKSIIIDAINAILGEKTSRDLIRTGADRASVCALFTDISDSTKSVLEEMDIECDDGTLMISRVMHKDGKNSCKINGTGVTVSMLKKVGISLINIHGQSDNQQLMNNELHYTFLDKLADNGELLEKYRSLFSQLISIRSQIKKLSMDEAEKERKIDLLSYQIDEIEKADITEGESDALTERKNILTNAKKILTCLNEAYTALNGSDDFGGAVQMLFDASEAMNKASKFMQSAEKDADALTDAAYAVRDIASGIASLSGDIDMDESELDDIDERLDLLYRLKKKYGSDEKEILAFLVKIKAELASVTSSEEQIALLKEKYEDTYNKTVDAAQKLSDSRMEIADVFCKQIENELSYLDMSGAEFTVSRELCPFTDTGIDIIEFMISANVGEKPKPLVKTASGGELSRIMLAIKSVLSDKDDTATLIFDEIDTGVSGHAAKKIAAKLYSVAKNHQVICITHLPSIASYADNHMKISKSSSDGKTYTKVTPLDYEGRKGEIARIISGSETDTAQLAAAEHMLNEAQGLKSDSK